MQTTRFVAVSLFLVADIVAAQTVTQWTQLDPTSAVGLLDGTTISATSSATAPFRAMRDNRFSTHWDADLPLPAASDSLFASRVNGGDWQAFTFEPPLGAGLLYIENFDSNSVATITAEGASVIELVSSSPSISFANGTLSTSNGTFNGEGDLILRLSGSVASLRLDFSGGDEANAVFYGLVSVPEPSTGAAAILTLALLCHVSRRRSR